jgi:hypothetical protein
MQTSRSLVFLAALLLSACAAVSTKVVPLNPAVQYPPTQHVEVLLERPPRPHVDIALLESRGNSEADLLNDAREKAKALGADAIVRIATERVDYPPIAVYDPWFDPFYWGPYRHGPFPVFPQPWGPYRVVGGGSEYVMKARAIKYTDVPG